VKARGTFDPPSRLLLGLESLGMVERSVFSVAGRHFVPECANERSPVLVLPGFTASDQSTRPLRQLMRRKGYSVHGWGLGANVGPHRYIVEGLRRRLAELYERYGAPVSLVGWSLGGIYARELARHDPRPVRLVITLGSPYRFRLGDRGHTSELYAAVAPEHDPFLGRAVPEHESRPLTVPATSIYSRTDGIVRWQACIEPVGPLRENIEVLGTHSGLGFNVAALHAIADRLNQPLGTWEPFHPRVTVRHLFPRPSAGRRWAAANGH
jgi:pimeloyl-ACP methyl ester carboxylesterase